MGRMSDNFGLSLFELLSGPLLAKFDGMSVLVGEDKKGEKLVSSTVLLHGGRGKGLGSVFLYVDPFFGGGGGGGGVGTCALLIPASKGLGPNMPDPIPPFEYGFCCWL